MDLFCVLILRVLLCLDCKLIASYADTHTDAFFTYIYSHKQVQKISTDTLKVPHVDVSVREVTPTPSMSPDW